MDKQKPSNLFKKFLAFVAGMILFILLCVGLVSASSLLSEMFTGVYLLFAAPVIFLVVLIFVWRKSMAMALGMLTCLVLMILFFYSVKEKASYEHRTWEARRTPGRVIFNSTPNGAQFFHVDTNTPIVTVSGGGGQYYRKEGKIVAIHKNYPDVLLYGEVKKNTYLLDFDFRERKVEDLQPPLLWRFLR